MTNRTSGTRTRATQMLTYKFVEICSTPLTTAPRRRRADNPTIKYLVREVSSNDIGEKDVPRKRLWDDCAGLNAADKTSKPSKSPKIRSLLHEIINDNSTKKQCISQGSLQMTKFSQKKVKPLAEVNVLPKPPHDIVTDVFPDAVLPTTTPEIVAVVFQEKEQPEKLAVESTPRTK